MSWQMVVRRQAVISWRDEQLLGAYTLFSAKVQEARSAFEQRLLEDARLYDTVWDPAGFAEPHIDAELRKILPKALADFLDDAATSLAKIAPEFTELSDALRRSHMFNLPQAPQAETAEPAKAVAKGQANSISDKMALPDAADQRWEITKRVEKLVESAGGYGAKGAEMVQKQADVFVEILQDKVGLRERVRIAAQKRIASHWMGESGDPRSVLLQLFRIIDGTTETARMTTL